MSHFLGIPIRVQSSQAFTAPNVRSVKSQLFNFRVIRWLTQPGYDEDLVLAALSFLHTLCSHNHALERLVEDHFRAVSTQLSIWLRHANRSSLSSTSSSSGISLFGGSGKKQVGSEQ